MLFSLIICWSNIDYCKTTSCLIDFIKGHFIMGGEITCLYGGLVGHFTPNMKADDEFNQAWNMDPTFKKLTHM